ncbi:MAG: hypothetical protein U0360_06505 [Dehalococcoidia bacterium]
MDDPVIDFPTCVNSKSARGRHRRACTLLSPDYEVQGFIGKTSIPGVLTCWCSVRVLRRCWTAMKIVQAVLLQLLP